ncbi:hypothetical protein GPNCGGLF_LOCUS525 [Methylorubrum aminovorans]
MSAVNLQELVKALILRGLAVPVIEEVVQELRLDLYSHDREAASPPRSARRRRDSTAVGSVTGAAWGLR